MTDHKQAAEAFVDAIRGSGNADLMWENDEGRQVPLEYAVAAALASVERETITSIATCIQVAAIAEQNGIARVSLFKLASEIRALAEEKGASREA